MTTTNARDTQIVADPDVSIIRIIRDFDAPPAELFRAHTDPDLLTRWIGPRSIETGIDHFDCRTGGSWRYTSIHQGEEYGTWELKRRWPGRELGIVDDAGHAGGHPGITATTAAATDRFAGRSGRANV